MSAYVHPVASVYTNVYADVHNTCLTYTPAHAWCLQHLSKCMHTLRKKCTCTRACTPMQRCRSFFAMETIANLSWVLREHRAGCRWSPTQPAFSTKSVARRCSLKKSVQIHGGSWRSRRCGVVQASFNHPRWCRPHPVSLWVALALGRGACFIKNSIFAIFSREFFQRNSPFSSISWFNNVPWWRRSEAPERLTTDLAQCMLWSRGTGFVTGIYEHRQTTKVIHFWYHSCQCRVKSGSISVQVPTDLPVRCHCSKHKFKISLFFQEKRKENLFDVTFRDDLFAL